MRKALCSCGQLSVTVIGEPQLVFACHCRECQKATGAPFGLSTYWPKDSVQEIVGVSSTYTRVGNSGRTLTNHFCPICGGRLFWYAEYFADSIGIPLGNFETQDLPAPTKEYWTVRRHPWVGFGCAIASYEGDE